MSTQATPTPTPASPAAEPTATPPAASPASSPAPAATPAPAKETESFLDDPTPAPAPKEGEEATFSAPTDVEEIEYDLELAEESLVPDDEFDALVEEAKKEGLTQKEAEARLKLLDSAYTKAKDTFLKSESKKLLSELVADPEFDTPEKQKAAKANIDQVYAAYKDPDFMKFVKSNPLVGNNKHFVKFLSKLGKSLTPEKPPIGEGAPAATAVKGNSILDLYPAHKEG